MWLGLQALAHCIDQDTASSAKRFPPLNVSYSTAACSKSQNLAESNTISQEITPLEVSGNQLNSLQLTFDEVIDRMNQTGEIYVEGDGSFVWCGRELCTSGNRCTIWLGSNGKSAEVQATPGWVADEPQQKPEAFNSEEIEDTEREPPSLIWRIEGNLYDGGTQLAYVQFVGAAPVEIWQKFLSLLIPANSENESQPMVFQLEQLGIILNTEEVLKVAA